MATNLRFYDRVILVLGTFCPVTMAHIEMGIMARSMVGNTDVWYVPSNTSLMKNWKSVDEGFMTDEERKELTRQAIKPYGFNLSSCDMDTDNENSGKTYDTYLYFKEKLGYKNIYICMGFDKLDELEQWENAEELFTSVKVLVFPRNGKSLSDCQNEFILRHIDNFISAGDYIPNISSTEVREAYYKGDLNYIKDSVPECVFDWLSEKSKPCAN